MKSAIRWPARLSRSVCQGSGVRFDTSQPQVLPGLAPSGAVGVRRFY
ncbi:hypothetical protein CNE_1c08100 [Cupriavidus necator N-1]|uniref:Uncharacterized protein n=1 Tax=Cupriavidus necator (strain ATCC 43291 / DSM 13513 / CCUG 52238 / LMG 8453 / N-1) TaxID=1042878 RepID=G0EY88_CUPNN|nr:hypothetical protein CNE_1c08100 [Cupriavidus necator N-1]KAI3609384.1 hypothetical protein D8I24_0788 [Cupriavidus necator H850]